MRILPIFIFTFLFLFNSVNGQERLKPFQTHNQSPLIHFFGLPTNPGGVVLKEGDFSFDNYLNIANNATSARIDDEAIYLDGETYRNEILLSYGLLSNLELSIQIPIIRHSGGMMDPFISRWHETFNLPGKARETMDDYNLVYAYMENEKPIINMNHSELKIGDISVSVAMPLFQRAKHHLAFRSFLKLSTGDKEDLIGSGTNDYGFQLNGSINPYSNERQFSFFYSGGYLRIGNGAILSDRIASNVVFGSLGLAYNINNKLIPKAQLDLHSGIYHRSTMKQLGEESVQLVVGVDYFVTERCALTGAFIEDIIVNTAPDFVLQFGVSYHF